MRNTFKVGDRVEFIDDVKLKTTNKIIAKGTQAKVSSLHPWHDACYLEFDDFECETGFFSYHLKLAEDKFPKMWVDETVSPVSGSSFKFITGETKSEKKECTCTHSFLEKGCTCGAVTPYVFKGYGGK